MPPPRNVTPRGIAPLLVGPLAATTVWNQLDSLWLAPHYVVGPGKLSLVLFSKPRNIDIVINQTVVMVSGANYCKTRAWSFSQLGRSWCTITSVPITLAKHAVNSNYLSIFALSSPMSAPTFLECLCQEQLGFGLTAFAPVADVSALACTNGRYGNWRVWRRRTDRWPCYPPVSTPSTTTWSALPDGPGWWNNRIAAQCLPLDLQYYGLTVDKNSLKPWRLIQ